MIKFKKERTIMVVSLGDDGAIIGCYRHGQLIKRMFVTSPLSSSFNDLIKLYPDAMIYLLLDTIDQNYIFSNIPNVGKSSVNKIVRRKLENEFDPNDLNSFVFLGKDESNAKKMLKYLFVSVRNISPLKDWLDALNELPNIFGGVYLLPVESEEFIKKIRVATHGEGKRAIDEWEIFVSYNRVGGFRQVVLKNERLIFTRISQSINLQTPDAIGNSISQESANTLEYIRRIGFYDNTISIYIVCAKEAANFIDIPGVKEKDIYQYSPFELSKKMGITQSAQENDKYGDVIFATNFANNKNKILKLSTKESVKAEKLVMLSQFISVSSIVLTALFLLTTIYFLISSFSISGNIKELDVKIKQKEGEFSNIHDFEKEYNANPETLMDVVKFKNDYSTKDAKYFELLKKYKEVDIYSNYARTISFESKNPTDINLRITVVFDFTGERNYSDILYKIEKYTVAVKSAFKDYNVKFEGLPNEADIKVDLENKKSEKENKNEVMVTITNAGAGQ